MKEINKSTYRIILIIAGVIHLIAFFFIPYATLGELLGNLSSLAGGGNVYPKSLTGLKAVSQSQSMAQMMGDAETGILLMIIFLLPVIFSIVILLLNIFGKKRLSYVGTIILSVMSVSGYGLIAMMIQEYQMMGYSIGPLAYFLIAICIAQIVVAIIGSVKDKGIMEKSVKASKNDGVLTGISGAYAGAQIPVEVNGMVTIGRDPKLCSVVVKGENISRKHCTISYQGRTGRYSVVDYSSNGVFDGNGKRIQANTSVTMDSGSELRIGDNVFRLGK